MYGWKGRIGLIIPSSNTTCEMEFHKLIPDGVSVHVARCFLPEAKTPQERVEAMGKMDAQVEEVARQVATVEPDLIVWACTSGSFHHGPGSDRVLAERLQRSIGIPFITTSTAVVEALKFLGVSRLAMVTPYIQEVNLQEKSFLEGSITGLRVVNMKGLETLNNLMRGRMFPETAYRAGREVDSESSDSIFISCTNWRTIEIIQSLEHSLYKPVISSTQATIWLAFKRLSLPNLSGYGRLLEKIQDERRS